jgi:hypothetical protein
MSELTEGQKKGYLRDPNECPYCISENIEVISDFDYETLSTTVACRDCSKTWSDCYTLTDVEGSVTNDT